MNTDNNDDLILVKTIEHNSSILKKRKNKNKETTDVNGRVLASKYYKNRRLICVHKYKYDENGNEIEHVFVQKNFVYYSEIHRYYNEINKCKKMEFYYAPKVIDSICYFEYDSHGNRTVLICQNSEGKLKHKFLCDINYKNKGKVITESCYKANGHLAWKANYIYNSKDFIVERQYIKNDLLFYKALYSYDSEDNKIMTKKYLHKSYLYKWKGENHTKIDFQLWT